MRRPAQAREKLTRAQQEIGPRGPADGLVAGREGLVEQHAAAAATAARAAGAAATGSW